MDNEEILNQIIWRLNILILLQLECTLEKEKIPISIKVNKLAELGLSATDISSIVNKPLNYITATISQKRKDKRNKR